MILSMAPNKYDSDKKLTFVVTKTLAVLYYVILLSLSIWRDKGRVQKEKKKLVENSTKRGEGAGPDFPQRKKTKKNMGLKHWMLPQDHFMTHLFFQFLGGGTLLSLDLGPKGVSNL